MHNQVEVKTNNQVRELMDFHELPEKVREEEFDYVNEDEGFARFFKLIERIISGELSEIVITHKDRLLRFGFELIHKLCSFFNVNIRILNDATPVSFEQELSQDIVMLMTV